MAQKRNTIKHPRRAGGDRRKLIGAVIVVLLSIAGVFIVLEKMKSSSEQEKTETVAALQTQKRSKATHDSSQRAYTSAQQSPAVRPPKTSRPVLRGSIAIIIDDMGASTRDLERLLTINMPLTFAIIPGLAHSRRVAEIAHAKGRGVMIHMPMEPQGYPQQRLEKNGLLLSQSGEEITRRVTTYLQEIPYATGANNHMGSGFTEHEEKMLPVLDVLKQHGMFFVDSKTSSRSVGYSMAVHMGIPAGTRTIFLDNEQSVEKVKSQLNQAARMAAQRGGIIAICHPHPVTIQALVERMPELRRDGITFAAASQLVR